MMMMMMKFHHLYHPNSVIYWKVQSHYLLLQQQQSLQIQRQKQKRKNQKKLYVHFQTINRHFFSFFSLSYFINKFNWIFSAISSTPEDEHSINVTTRVEVNTSKLSSHIQCKERSVSNWNEIDQRLARIIFFLMIILFWFLLAESTTTIDWSIGFGYCSSTSSYASSSTWSFGG